MDVRSIAETRTIETKVKDPKSGLSINTNGVKLHRHKGGRLRNSHPVRKT